jgi:16S rRNA (uracil1498-N3)-methyltransferase
VRITRLYHPEQLVCGETTHLDVNASNHLIRVLRAKLNTAIVLFNGDGFDYLASTLDENPKKTLVSVDSKVKTNTESSLNITLVQGLSRQDRMETTIQKSVELGVNRIIPILCQRSNTRLTAEKQDKKIAHWKKVAISACEQSGRNIIPAIENITALHSIEPQLNQDASKFILNPDSKTSLKDIDVHQQLIEIFIGPEGGLNDDEIGLLEELHFRSICFGPRILRTETAGPAVISALQMLWGDF